jgi:hypothetical protein
LLYAREDVEAKDREFAFMCRYRGYVQSIAHCAINQNSVVAVWVAMSSTPWNNQNFTVA